MGLLDHGGTVTRCERGDRALRQRLGFTADDARVAAEQRLGAQQQFEPLVKRALERVDPTRTAPVAERGRDRRERRARRGRGQRAGHRDRGASASSRPAFETSRVAANAKPRPGTDTRMPTPSSLVHSIPSTCPPLTRSCSAVRATQRASTYSQPRGGLATRSRRSSSGVSPSLRSPRWHRSRRSLPSGRARRSRVSTEQVDDEDQGRVRGDAAWTSSVASSQVGIALRATGSDAPVPRRSKRISRLKDASCRRNGPAHSHTNSRWLPIPVKKTKSSDPSPSTWYATSESPTAAYFVFGRCKDTMFARVLPNQTSSA